MRRIPKNAVECGSPQGSQAIEENPGPRTVAVAEAPPGEEAPPAGETRGTYIPDVLLDHITPTSDNPRVISEDDPAMIELAASIRAHGVLQPVLLRLNPGEPGNVYDLRAGARRYIASRMAGKTTIPAIVRDMTDQEAFEITVIENLQRNDLRPIEEARGVQTMLDKGWAVPVIAAHLGKSPAWVVRRAQITRLSPKWMKAVLDPKGIACDAPAGHLELIARLPEEAQESFYSGMGRRYYGGPRQQLSGFSLKELEDELGAYTRNLRSAKWSLSDEDLVPKTGACLLCAKRSSHQPGLFDDFDAGEEALKKSDRCLDPDCWEKKLGAFTVRKHEELKKEHSAVLLTTDYNGGGRNKPFVEGQTVGHWEYEKAKKSTPGAVPLMTVNGDNAGRVEWVKPKANRSAERQVERQKKAARKSSQRGNPEERKCIAREFADAWLAHVYARHLFLEEAPAPQREEALAAAFIEMQQRNAETYDKPRLWLQEILGPEKCKLDDRLLNLGEKELLYRITATGLFDYVHNMLGHPFSGEPRKTPFKFPSEIQALAAQSFVPPASYFEKHRKDDLVIIGRQMGLPVKVTMRAMELKDMLSKASKEFGRLRAGEITAMPEKWAGYSPLGEDLAKAFGQPWKAPATAAAAAEKAEPRGKRGRPRKERVCKICGCTDLDCLKCIEKTGAPCYWVKPNLCSACAAEGSKVRKGKP